MTHTWLQRITAVCGICLLSQAYAGTAVRADDFEDFRKAQKERFNTFRDKAKKEYEDFRDKANAELADFMKRPWPKFVSEDPKEQPVEPEPDPIIIKDDEPEPQPNPEPQPIVIKQVVDVPKPKPQPQPVAPIVKTVPVEEIPPVDLTFYGTPLKLSGVKMPALNMSNTTPATISDAYTKLSAAKTANLLHDCLQVRTDRKLCDWAYLTMLGKIADKFYRAGSNENKLVLGYLLNQSGYDIRYCTDTRGVLNIMIACDGIMYGYRYITLNGKEYYVLTPEACDAYNVCDFKFPGEKALSFAMPDMPVFDYAPGQQRTITCHSHPDIKATVTPNKNLIDFYNDYPRATISKDSHTLWAIHGNVPASKELKADLYPTLRTAVQGKNQREAANILIKLAESFEYKRDPEMWGVADRAFFPDETWQYYYSDCEDHAIHFTRLVRDILGLEAVLVYYPGHLASAVAFTDGSVAGDYVMHNGKRFTICDPTIFYGPVGVTMRGMDNQKATLIDLTM